MEGAVDLREFTFFDESDAVLFVRNDAESAGWQVDEMNLNCLFPYDENKVITRGMRIGFVDDDGALQAFEIRKVRDYEPDHYQEVTAEHIVISELTDVHMDESELTDVNPASALYLILSKQASGITGAKRWALGNVTATNISSGDIGTGSAFQNIRTIETNWNVYILPRLTFDSTGITGRYLDIVPAEGVWHGLRLSVDKNADEIGVTVDDTEVKTALYGYGGTAYTISQNQLDKTGQKITLVGYNWTNKPSGASKATADGFIVDTNANALYGRNGIPRFGFYQNADITDQATLAQKTWEALQTVNKPVVTVDCNVKDLYRLGYHDEKIRLHDTALIEILPIHDLLTLEIVKLYVDLLDPTATRPTIGEYTPNIIFIQRETADDARGGSGGSISGRVGGETEKEAEWSEFQAEFVVNNTILSYHATQVDHDNKVLKAAGLDIDANGAIIYAEDNTNMIGSKFKVQAEGISSLVTKTGVNSLGVGETLYSEITQNADNISLIVQNVGDDGTVTAASIISSVNNGDSSIKLNANHIQITGETGILGDLTVEGVLITDDIFTSGGLSSSETIYSNALSTNSIAVEGDISCQDLEAETITTTGAIDCALGVDVGENLTVAGTATVTGATTLSGDLTVSGDTELCDIFADSLELTGGISASSGAIVGASIDVGTYAGYKVNGTSIGLGDGIKSISLTGPVNDVYTLSATQFDGDTITIGTFSRATTLSGAWDSGVFTVSASPQGDEKTTSLTNTGHWGVAANGEDENTYYYTTYATIDNGTVPVDTGNSTTISGLGRYNAGITEGESHFKQATVTLEGSSYGSITPVYGSGVVPSREVLPIAYANGTHYLRYTTALKLSHFGNKTLYVAPTGGSQSYTYDWYYVDRYGTSYYESAGSATAYSYSNYTYYTVPSTYSGTRLYQAGSDITNLRNPGTPDSTTYFTYDPS